MGRKRRSEATAVVNKDRMTFEEACKELGVSDEELEQLVANGEIACLKEGNDLIFKKDVVGQFKKTRKTEPTIILTEEDMGILEGMEEIGTSAPKPAAEHGEKKAPQPIELEGLEDVVIESRSDKKDSEPTPAPAAATPDDTVLNLEGLLEDDGSEGTTPIPGTEVSAKPVDESTDITVEGNVSDETLLDTDLLEIGEEEDSFKLDTTASDEALTEPAEAQLLRGGGARAMQMKRKKAQVGTTIALIFTAVVLLAPLAIVLNIVYTARASATAVPVLLEDTTKDKGKTKKEDVPYKWILDANAAGGVVEAIADLFG